MKLASAVLRALSMALSIGMLTACITPTTSSKKTRQPKNGAKVAEGKKGGSGLYNGATDLDKKLLERGERSRYGSSLGSL